MMSNFQNCLKLPKYVSKRNIALLDANLLLVYLIAQFDINPQDFERTKKFNLEDCKCIKEILARFKAIVTTPHVLTEVSNLAGKLGKDRQAGFRGFLAKYIQLVTEHNFSSENLTHTEAFYKFGLTDAALFSICQTQNLILFTDDFPLAQYTESKNIKVINYNHYRPYTP